MRNRETVWTFNTAQFEVRLILEDEDLHPADTFDRQEDIDAVTNGDVLYFCAVVEVVRNGYVIGRDTLGACAYKSAADFYASHRDRDPMNRNCSLMRAKHGRVTICHYFPDMVREAIAAARGTLDYYA